jgi:hypothetical protein
MKEEAGIKAYQQLDGGVPRSRGPDLWRKKSGYLCSEEGLQKGCQSLAVLVSLGGV